eukprot:16386925-Heterocapsa_arctica.AAC.1
MPTAVRALRARSKLHSFGEGAGIPREAVAMIGIQMIKDGHILEAIVVFLCYDGWLREQDWTKCCGLRTAPRSRRAESRLAW